MPTAELAIVKKIPVMPTQIGIGAEWIAERDALIQEAAGIVCTNAEQHAVISRLLARVTTHSNGLEKVRKTVTDPFLQAQKLIKGVADDAREPLENTKSKLEATASNWMAAERQRARDEERRLAKEAQDKAIAAAEQAALDEEIFGDDVPPPPEPEPPPPLPVTVLVPVNKFAKTVEKPVIDQVDLNKVPRIFLMLDEGKVKYFMQENKEAILKALFDETGQVFIEGITFKLETKTSSRG